MCSANAFFTLRARVSPRRTHLCWPRAQRAAKIFGCAEHVRSLGRAHAPNSLVTQSRDRTSTEAVHRQTHRPAPLVRRSRSGCAASEIPPRERSERRKFWPYGRKSRPPNALLLCARVIRGGEHPSRHKRFGRTNVAGLVRALVSQVYRRRAAEPLHHSSVSAFHNFPWSSRLNSLRSRSTRSSTCS